MHRTAIHVVSCAILAATLTACHRSRRPEVPLTHRAYVWQREWTPAVKAAVEESKSKLAGHVVLGAEITWRSTTARPVRATIDWASLGSSCALALRVAPWAGPFDDASAKPVIDEALHLLSEAKAHGVACAELQLDFDCAQKKLAGYERWVRAVRTAIQPARLVITTLPVWLDEPEFKTLIAAADSYVLQVHSVLPAKKNELATICDPERARKCVEQANALGRDFEVALSTYSALVGFDAAGKLLGYHFEGPAPDWPADAKIMQFRSEPEEMAALVREWRLDRPAHLRGVLWYRLPLATDRQNWKLPQLYAAIEGRPLRHDLAAASENENPVDVMLINRGEADEPVRAVRVSWDGVQLVASDALPGWRIEPGTQSVTFHPGAAADGGGRRAVAIPALPPGARRSIGWLRFDKRPSVLVEVVH
ncbi:MAG: DUF3142 domain-containing protein [Verrucomicrobiaceae bacterium]|nr:DUF3142 domain-containing protein [Verrucomicrobiaceae bacterium]